MKKVVVNTSPLIVLGKIGRLDLLPRLYSPVMIPGSVLAELEARPGEELVRVQSMLEAGTFSLRNASKACLDRVPPDLGPGEREVIALGLETRSDLVILDDRQGRAVARLRGLTVTGSIGVLVEARSRSLIPSVRHELDRMIEAGLWVSEAFYDQVLRALDE